MENLTVKQTRPAQSSCPSFAVFYDRPVTRAGRSREIVNRYAYTARDEYVGRLVTVASPDPLAGLIVWVSVEEALRDKGFGMALHAAVQRDLGTPLLLDLAFELHCDGLKVPKTEDYPAFGLSDRVSAAEYRVWDAMVKSSNWYVRNFGGRFLIADCG